MQGRSASFPRIASQSFDPFNGYHDSSSSSSSSASSSRSATPSIASTSNGQLFAPSTSHPNSLQHQQKQQSVPPLILANSETRFSPTWSNSDQSSSRSGMNESFNDDEELQSLQRQYPTLAAKLFSDGKSNGAPDSRPQSVNSGRMRQESRHAEADTSFASSPAAHSDQIDDDDEVSRHDDFDDVLPSIASSSRPSAFSYSASQHRPSSSQSSANSTSSSGLVSLAIVEPNHLFRHLLESSSIAAPPISSLAMSDVTSDLAEMIKARARIALTEGVHFDTAEVPMVPRDFARTKAPAACSQSAQDRSEPEIRRCASQLARRQFSELIERGLPLGGAPIAMHGKQRPTIIRQSQVPLQPSTKRHVSRTLRPVFY